MGLLNKGDSMEDITGEKKTGTSFLPEIKERNKIKKTNKESTVSKKKRK